MARKTTSDPLSRQIGRRIRKLRAERGFDFDAFVEETGLSRGYISILERGAASPTVRSLAKLARALDVTVADLVLGESERERIFEISARLPIGEVRRLLRDVESRLKEPTER